MPPGHALYPADLTRAQIDSYLASHPGKKDEIYNPYTLRPPSGSGSGRPAVPRRVRAIRRRRRDGIAARRGAVAGSGVRQVSADARRRAVDRRLLRERRRVGRAAEPQGRRDLRALRNLPGRFARRENVVRRGDSDPERSREPQPREVSAVGARHPGCAAAPGSRPAVGARPRDADGSDGRPLQGRRLAARLPGGRRQSAERSAHSSGEGHQEDLLQELHGRARQGSHPAAGRAPDGSGTGASRVGGRLSRIDRDARDLPRARAGVRPPRRQTGRRPRSDWQVLLRSRGGQGRRRRHVRA